LQKLLLRLQRLFFSKLTIASNHYVLPMLRQLLLKQQLFHRRHHRSHHLQRLLRMLMRMLMH
jgi:hypothetical protein